MAGMSTQEKIGQLVVYTIPARSDKQNKRLLRNTVEKYHVGAILFGKGSAEEQAILTNLAQKESKVPLFITFDGEWGAAMRLNDMPAFPRNASLGCIADKQLLYDYGREVARELRELGVSVNFAPDADVNTNPFNPIINIRSFGDTPQPVAERATLYMRGLQAGGVMAVAKHFPGHGDTDVDSHLALPVLNHDRARLDSIELYPFRQLIDAGVGGVMVGHLQVRAIDTDSTTAASFSHKIVTEVLRNELGFKGLVFTDALAMKGTSSVPQVTTKALLAGNDMVLIEPATQRIMTELYAAVEAGTLPLSMVEEKCRRILTCKYLLGVRRRPSPLQVSGISLRMNTPEARALAARLNTAAVTVLGNDFGVLPLKAVDNQPITVLSVGEGKDSLFVEAMKQHAPVPVEHIRLTPADTTAVGRLLLEERLAKCRRLVVSVSGNDVAPTFYAPYLASLRLQAPVVYVYFTSYLGMQRMETALGQAAAVVLGHSAEPEVQEYVAQVLFAKAPAQGRLSMNIGSLYRAGEGTDITPGMQPGQFIPEDYGMRSRTLAQIDQIARQGVTDGAYPGCQVLILKEGIPIYDRRFGTRSDKDTTAVRPTDMFDLASLTKTSATLLAVMKLYDEGRLKLTDKASATLSFLRKGDKRNITIRELLLHESGLPPFIRFYQEAIDPKSVHGPYAQSWVDQWHQTQISEHSYYSSDFRFKKGLMAATESPVYSLHVADGMWLNKSFKDNIMKQIANSTLSGKRYVYSDLNFILLQQVVEAITGMSLDLYLDKEFYAPMGLTRTLFLPLRRFTKQEVMPTATNDYLRRQDICGYVHDEAAAFMGGIAGHAGLFSTAGEIGKIYQMLLNGGEYNGKRYLSEATCRLFTTETSPTSRRGLGFDKPDLQSPKSSPCAPTAGATVYGHTGFTGTCVWVDPTNRTVYVFMSNHLCPNAWDTKLGDQKIRQRIQEVMYQSQN
jgi:beta-glucosidase-like glycosyl hydrolase/CubicO group peptidase (beta-lactamase class C family)